MQARTMCPKRHSLSMAHSPTPAGMPQLMYVVCGVDGCPQRLVLHVADWLDELERRELAQAEAGAWGQAEAGAWGQAELFETPDREADP